MARRSTSLETNYAPTSDLPTGVVYWRVHPGATTTVTSPTWQFTVGARSTEVDTSSGTNLDVNGDGYTDVVIGAYGWLYVYLGTAHGLATSPASTLSDPSGSSGSAFGMAAESAGDVNGDGYADLVAGDYLWDGNVGRAYVYLGSASGLGTTPAATLNAGISNSHFGASVSSAGDVNRDGYADIIVLNAQTGEEGVVQPPAQAHVYLGGATGIATVPAAVLGGDFDQVSAAGNVDVDGDGYSDLVMVGGSGVLDETGTLDIYRGSAAGLSLTPDTTLNLDDGTGNSEFSIASAGDVNGDGYPDFIIPSFQNTSIYLGSATGLAGAPATTLPTSPSFFPLHSGCSADVNGDGYSDVVLTFDGTVGNPSTVFIYMGSATGLSTVPGATFTGVEAPLVRSAGDVNGDGYTDVVAGDYSLGNFVGAAYVYVGGATGLSTAASPTLSGPSGHDGGFGASVFGASN